MLQNSGARLAVHHAALSRDGARAVRRWQAATARRHAAAPADRRRGRRRRPRASSTSTGRFRRSRPSTMRLAVMLYTSGTTADPKGVVLTHANLDAERAGAFAVVTVTETDALLGVLPLFHALAQMANLLLPLAVGARVVFLETVSSIVARRGARIARHHDLRVRAAVLLSDSSARHGRGRARRARSRAGLLRGVIGANVWLRDHTGLNPAKPLFGRIHRPLGPTHAPVRHRRVEIRSRHPARSLRPRLHDPERLRPDGNLGRRHDHAARPIGSTSRSASRCPASRFASRCRTRQRR